MTNGERIQHLEPREASDSGTTPKDKLLFVEAVLRICHGTLPTAFSSRLQAFEPSCAFHRP